MSNLFSVTDNTPPTVSIDTPEDTEIGATLEFSWIADDNTGLSYHHLYYSLDDGQSFTFIDSVDGDSNIFDWVVPNIISNEARIRIESHDLVDLIASDSSDTFIILDGISPVITVTAPVSNYSIPEYYDLTVTWEASDNIGLDSVKVYYSNDGGQTFEIEGMFNRFIIICVCTKALRYTSSRYVKTVHLCTFIDCFH